MATVAQGMPARQDSTCVWSQQHAFQCKLSTTVYSAKLQVTQHQKTAACVLFLSLLLYSQLLQVQLFLEQYCA